MADLQSDFRDAKFALDRLITGDRSSGRSEEEDLQLVSRFYDDKTLYKLKVPPKIINQVSKARAVDTKPILQYQDAQPRTSQPESTGRPSPAELAASHGFTPVSSSIIDGVADVAGPQLDEPQPEVQSEEQPILQSQPEQPTKLEPQETTALTSDQQAQAAQYYKEHPEDTRPYNEVLAEQNQQTEPQPEEPVEDSVVQFADNPRGVDSIDTTNIDFGRGLGALSMWNPVGAQASAEEMLNQKIQDASTDGHLDPNKIGNQLAIDQNKRDLDNKLTKSVTDNQNVRKFADAMQDSSNALSAWTPVGIGMLGGGVDRSGEAAGYAAQAAQNQYNAAQNEKLRQQNMQQASDNTIAEKMAAAEADAKWKQNARALKEGGAQAVASQNEAVTPDLWKQKQLQNERRDVAAQNLAETNRNKLMAIGNETNESMTNYATNVEDNQNAYKAALANAAGSSSANSTAKKPEEKKEEKQPEEPKDETPATPSTPPVTEEKKEEKQPEEPQPEGTKSVAPSNQESEGTETVTDKMKAQQIRDRIEAIYHESEEAAKTHDAATLKKLTDEYNGLVTDFEALPQEVKQGGYRQFDPSHGELNKENAKYDYSNIITGVNQRF